MNVIHVTTDLGETDILRREFSAIDPDLRVECAGTAREAIERLEAGTSHYDVVLLELTQMNGEGLSLVSHIRKNNLPVGVVAITSAREHGPSREVLEGGADHIVVKGKEFLPRLPTVLAHAVERRTLEARLRVMLETAPVCLMRVARDGTILAMNIAALDMVDAERPDEVVDQSWYERVMPDAQPACRDFIERASNGERGSFECQIERRSGTPRTVLMHAGCAPVDATGVPSAIVVMRDLDKTRVLEAGLEQFRHKLGALETALSEAEAQNQQLEARHEAERAEWQQQPPSIDATAERTAWEQAGTTVGEERVKEHRAEREALEYALKAAEAQCQQLSADHEAERTKWQQRLAAGKAQEEAVVEQLFTEHEKLESALQAAAAQQQSPTDLTVERATWEQAEALRRQALVDEHRAEREALEDALNTAEAQCQQLSADHEAEQADWQQQRAAGKAREGAVVEQLAAEHEKLESALQAADAQQRLVDQHQAARDELESASRALQDQVRQGQSLETVASFMRDAGADLEKLAATIATESAVVLESLPDGYPRREAAASLSSAAVRAAALTHQLLAISRKHQRATRTMHLNAAIGQLEPVLRRLVGEDIEFAVEPAAQLDPVTVNPDLVEQLLLRLAVVIREAMPAGGIVRLGTSSIEIHEAHMREYPGVPPGQYARFTLSASGWGMDSQMQDRVSNAVAGGEDSEGAKELGLASALRAFRQAGCHIAAQAEPGRELRVDGYLPTGGQDPGGN